MAAENGGKPLDIVIRFFEGIERNISADISRYLPISAESRFRRPVGVGNAYTPARAGFAGDAHTPANEKADGTTWLRRRPYGA